tara:strand:- start:1081 stop:1356 length:276 start_codon:yes stop_codon:yes gene_type:complete
MTNQKYTQLEKQILIRMKEILEETEIVLSAALVFDNPKLLRGALASLVKKEVLSVETNYANRYRINGRDYYHVDWIADSDFDEEVAALFSG